MQRIVCSIVTGMLCAITTLHAQDPVRIAGTLRIHSGATLTSFGDFHHASTGAFLNNGVLHVKRDVVNDAAAMSAASGITHFSGSVLQTVSGTQLFRTWNLTTNNAAGVLLTNSMVVHNTHTYTAGMISTSGLTPHLIYESTSSYSGASDARHVNGRVRRVGSSAFTFPVGNGTYMRPITLTNLSASSTFNVYYPGATVNTSNVQSPLTVVDPFEHWEVTQTGSATAQVTMNWDNSKIQFPNFVLADIRAAQYSGGMWTDRGGTAVGDVSTTGSITSNVVGTFTLFTFGSHSAVLSSGFLTITANRMNKSTLVQWKTAQEEGIAHFEVERSDNSTGSFRTIGNVAAKNVRDGSSYLYHDFLPLEGTAYYRIKRVDLDGRSVRSAIVAVSARVLSGDYCYVQNPVTSAINFTASPSYRGNYVYEIVSGAGQIVQRGRVEISSGVVSIPLNARVFPGNYVFRILNPLRPVNQKVVVR